MVEVTHAKQNTHTRSIRIYNVPGHLLIPNYTGPLSGFLFYHKTFLVLEDHGGGGGGLGAGKSIVHLDLTFQYQSRSIVLRSTARPYIT